MAALLNKYGLTIGIPETGFILKVILLATVLIVVCWWDFSGYTYLRREYFYQPAIDNTTATTDVS
jgi:hypothetical protein